MVKEILCGILSVLAGGVLIGGPITVMLFLGKWFSEAVDWARDNCFVEDILAPVLGVAFGLVGIGFLGYLIWMFGNEFLQFWGLCG